MPEVELQYVADRYSHGCHRRSSLGRPRSGRPMSGVHEPRMGHYGYININRS